MAEPRTAQEIQSDRQRLLDSVGDAVAVAQTLGEPMRSLALPGIITGVISAKSIGGILKRLFGTANRDQIYAVQTNTYPIVTTAAVGVGATNSADFNITQDSDFYAMRMAITSGNDGTGTFDFLIQLTLNASGRRLMFNQGGGHVLGYQGTGQRPFVFPNPLFLPRNQTMTVSLSMLTANVRTVFIDLIGRKTLDVSALDLTTRRW